MVLRKSYFAVALIAAIAAMRNFVAVAVDRVTEFIGFVVDFIAFPLDYRFAFAGDEGLGGLFDGHPLDRTLQNDLRLSGAWG